jgi:hypothetical protein
VYVALVTDAYARRILGWRVATTMTTQLVRGCQVFCVSRDVDLGLGLVS